jgi:hypothetical protein
MVRILRISDPSRHRRSALLLRLAFGTLWHVLVAAAPLEADGQMLTVAAQQETPLENALRHESLTAGGPFNPVLRPGLSAGPHEVPRRPATSLDHGLW